MIVQWLKHQFMGDKPYDPASDPYIQRMREVRRTGLQSARDAERSIRNERARQGDNPFEESVFPPDSRMNTYEASQENRYESSYPGGSGHHLTRLYSPLVF